MLLAAVALGVLLILGPGLWSRLFPKDTPASVDPAPASSTNREKRSISASPGINPAPLPPGLDIPLRPRAAGNPRPAPPQPAPAPPPRKNEPPAAPAEPPQASTSELENQLLRQVQFFLQGHANRLPTSLAELVGATDPTVNPAKLAEALQHFEFVPPPPGFTQANDAFWLFRERTPVRLADGQWVRHYVTAGGSSRVITLLDGDFEAWERRSLPQVTPAPAAEPAAPAAEPADHTDPSVPAEPVEPAEPSDPPNPTP